MKLSLAVPGRTLAIISFLLSLLSIGVISYSSAQTAGAFALVAVVGGCLAYRNEWAFWKLFLLAVPLLGFLNIVLRVHAMPLLMPVLYAGVLGILIHRRSDSPAFSIPVLASVVLYAAFLFASFFRGIIGVSGHGLRLFSVVAVTPWAKISFANALGWMLYGLSVSLSGVFFFVFFPRDEKSWTEGLKLLLSACLISAVVGLLQSICCPGLAGAAAFGTRTYSVFNATFVEPSVTGFCCAVLLVLCLAQPQWRVGMKIVFTVALALLLALSASRAAFILLIVGLVVLSCDVFLLRRKLSMQAVFISLAVALVCLGLYKVLAGGSRLHAVIFEFARGGRSFLRGGSIADLAAVLLGDRLTLWRQGWRTFAANPVLGVGLGSFLFRMPAFLPERIDVVNDHAQNMYLHILAEQGLLGLSAFFVAVASVIFPGARVRASTGLGSLAALSGIMVAFIFGSQLVFFESTIMFWFVLRGVALHD